MGKWTKTAGLIFLAAASVYSSQVIVEMAENRANPAKLQVAAVTAQPQAAQKPAILSAPADGTQVKVLEEASSSDPFAPTEAPAAAPAGSDAVASTDELTLPSDTTETKGAATTQPTEGRSVSSSEVSVNDAGTVEIHVNDANLVEVLRMLSLQSQKNIIASKDVHGTVTANLYEVTVREALDAILHSNGFAYREKGNFIYVYTAKEIADIEAKERTMQTQVFRVYYTPAANAANMIKPVLSKAGGEVAVTTPTKAGIASAPAGGGGNDHGGDEILVVTDYPENIEAARKILAEVDRRPQQILLEATVVRAKLNEDNALGVDFNIVGGVDFGTITHNNGQFTNAQLGDVAGDRAHSVGTGNSFSAPINGGLKVGYVTDSVSIFLSALEQVTDTTVLANPKVLALNRQQGEVFVGNEDGYYTTLTTETTTSQSVESLKTGTRLIFRPYIGADGYIRMEVHPEDSDGQVKANGLPSKTTTEVTSNVMVKDGHTVVIGGLFRESTVSGKSQVPFVGNLPLAGYLFKSQRDRTIREEVIILLTPHIVKDDASYSKLSEEQLKHAEDMRVGVRKGLMPWGRERLAEGWYQAAVKQMNKQNPNRGMAQWYLNCATNLNPTFTEAIELKEEISGHQVSTADGSSIRGFVRRSMLNDVAPATRPAAEAPTTQPAGHVASTQPSESEDVAENKDLSPAMIGTEEASTSEEVSVPSDSENATSTSEEAVEGATAETPMEDAVEQMPEDAVESAIEPAVTEEQTSTESDSQGANATEVTPVDAIGSENSESAATGEQWETESTTTTESASTESQSSTESASTESQSSTESASTESQSDSESASTESQSGSESAASESSSDESLTVIPLDEVPATTEEQEQK